MERWADMFPSIGIGYGAMGGYVSIDRYRLWGDCGDGFPPVSSCPVCDSHRSWRPSRISRLAPSTCLHHIHVCIHVCTYVYTQISHVYKHVYIMSVHAPAPTTRATSYLASKRLCLHANLHTCLHTVCICLHKYKYTCVHKCAHPCVIACIHTCLHIGLHTCLHIGLHTCLHICLH